MKNITKIIGLIALSVWMLSCETTKNSPQEKSKVKNNSLNLEFNFSASKEISNPKATLVIYGFDSRLADMSATVIAEKEVVFDTFPKSVIFNLPNKPVSLIVPKVSDPENAMYYIGLQWDSNGDGKKDKEDVRISYEKGIPMVDLSSSNVQSFQLK